MLIGESNVAIDPAIGGYGVADIYLGEFPPQFWRGGAWSGVPGVGARCGNGLFSTYKSPKFDLSFTILVSFILVRYPDRIGLVNTVGTVGNGTRYRYLYRGRDGGCRLQVAASEKWLGCRLQED